MTWWREADRPARRAFLAASLGWMLDSFDINLYALVLPSLMAGLQIDQSTSGTIQALMLLSAAAGGLVFGVIADRWGRTRALILSVLIYSVFTAASGLATNALQLAVFRILLGLGMGGEWASGAALVSETWPDRHRSKALGFMQSAWAIGFMLAALVNWLIQDVAGLDWRSVFFVGVLPAALTLWIRRKVPEPARWHAAKAAPRVRLRDAMGGPMARITIALALMNACALFAYWGFNTWMPSFLKAAPAAGGIGLSNATMSAFVLVNNVGMWFGYVTFGLISDSVGRRRTYVSYLVLAAVCVLLYTSTKSPWALLALGPITSFFATGHFSGFGAVTAELYPTSVRATAQGFTYNVGRILSAAAPAIAGSVAQTSGYPAALSLAAGAYIVAALFWVLIPDTTGRELR
jgi:MFS family permease